MVQLSSSQAIFRLVICWLLVRDYCLVLSQMCSDGQVTLQGSSSSSCEGNEDIYIQCTAKEPTVTISRNGAIIYNRTSLVDDLQSRASASVLPWSDCYRIFVTFHNISVDDAGNYTCRTNMSESDVLSLVVERRVSEHDCLIEPTHGPIVEDGENVTCRSRTGHPSWVELEASPSEVDTGSTSTVALMFNASTSFSTTLTCRVTSFDESLCPAVTLTCNQRVLVVPSAIGSYISISPSVNIIRLGEAATFSCVTTLSGTGVMWTPLEGIAPEEYSIHKASDTDTSITFHNITTNFTEPVIQCSLQYNGEQATSISGSVVVLPPVEEREATSHPTTISSTPFRGDVQGTMTGTSEEVTVSTEDVKVVSTVEDTEKTSEPAATTAATTRNVGGGGSGGFDVDIRILIAGFVIGLLIFLAIVVLIALLLRQKAKKKDTWTVDTTSNRRGRAEVASSDSVQGKLEWETDTNPLVIYETHITSFSNCDDNDGNSEDGEQTIESMRNGYLKHTGEPPPTISLTAVIENHDRHKDDVSSNKDDKGTTERNFVGISKGGYEPSESLIVVHHHEEETSPEVTGHETKSREAETDRTHVTENEASFPNGLLFTPTSHPRDNANSNPIESGTHQGEVSLDVLNFIDATKGENEHSAAGSDSGLSESILSEIDDNAINIVAV